MAVLINNELTETIKVWSKVSSILSTIHTEEQYNKTVSLLDELIDKVSQKEDSLIESLIDTMGTLVKDYEDRTLKEPEGDPIGCLKFLMAEHGLTAKDLIELGSQEDVSKILNGKKSLDLAAIKILSRKFNVSPAVFI